MLGIKRDLATFVFVRLEDADPEVARLAEKLDELIARQVEVNREYDGLLLRRQEAVADGKKYNANVEMLVGDRDPDTALDLRSITQAIDENRRLYADLAEALSIIRDRLDKAKGAAGRRLAESARPYVHSLEAALASSLLDVAGHLAAYHGAIAKMNETIGPAWVGAIGARQPHMLGNPADRNSPLARYLLEAAARGMIDRAQLPRAWR